MNMILAREASDIHMVFVDRECLLIVSNYMLLLWVDGYP